MTPWRGPVIVTGTDTGVGKTIVTAAIAAAATQSGLRVAVVKPGQTGVADGEETDAEAVQRFAAPATVRTLASYPDPLAPLTAARVAGLAPLVLADVLTAVEELAADHELVLVEGAGGLLVQLGDGGWSIADLAIALGAPAVVVARAGLGTLNHVALTLEALDRREIPAAVVIGSWPAQSELVHRTNLEDLPTELAGIVPDGVGGWQPARFRERVTDWLAPELYGAFDAEKFRSAASSV
ncbi:ATP-dependent dethiobiotin synthetase BioD [Planosporangium thailandense]|uniref:ATP-dependent dethiobiotin synthetase BioD n=1 Tax=Planosporangium thailandense TaxID=765197 RepID=A0ABX0XUZ9_9ACTN|nr:dethiobiotin synthase [Planosporangium thailandense]NJC69853.1 ATP-dependent dethiobiotin synthetase BioD [Planosporangium thailandense]